MRLTALPRIPKTSTLLHNRPGFTLVELLVVISIIAVLFGISFPVLRGLTRGTGLSAAVNQSTSAVAAARAYSTRPTPSEFSTPVNVGGVVQTAVDDGDGYSGTIALFTPSNEIRVMENDALAEDASGDLLELLPTALNGYRDLIINPGDPDPRTLSTQRLSTDVILLGITRDASGVRLLPAPFAIGFNRRGSMILTDIDGGTNRNFVFVDGDFNGRIDTNSNRANFGVGELSGFRRGDSTAEDERDDDGRYRLPFEKIETVIGIVMLDRDNIFGDVATILTEARLEQATALSNADSDTILNNLTELNGRILFFNRYTGSDIGN